MQRKKVCDLENEVKGLIAIRRQRIKRKERSIEMKLIVEHKKGEISDDVCRQFTRISKRVLVCTFPFIIWNSSYSYQELSEEV